MLIVVDTSALIAIFEAEPEAPACAAALASADRLLISAVSVHETGLVLRARPRAGRSRALLPVLTVDNDFEIVPSTRNRPALPSPPLIASEKGSIPPPASTSPTAPPMPWRGALMLRFSSRAKISTPPTSAPASDLTPSRSPPA